MLEDLPVLLKFNFENKILTLRLDYLGLLNFNNDNQAICELTLRDCSNTDNLINDLQELIGQIFEYEICTIDDNKVLEFWGDYSRVCSKVKFKSINEIFSEYTNEDLILKGKRLSFLYTDLYQRFNQNQAINSKIRNKLNTQIKDEITRFERKAEFFDDKSQAFQQSVKILQKLLKILEKRE